MTKKDLVVKIANEMNVAQNFVKAVVEKGYMELQII